MQFKKTLVICILSCFIYSELFEGYIIYTPGGGNASNTSYLRDWNDNIINTWSHSTGPASMPYFLPSEEGGMENSLLYYPCRAPNPTMETGGVGGRVDILNWDGELLYRYEIASTYYNHHHDIAVLPNGNFIVIAWERLYSSDWEDISVSSMHAIPVNKQRPEKNTM